MIHSLLIVGGTVKKRSRASEEKSFALKTPSERSSGPARLRVAEGESGGESLAERPQKFDTTILEPEEDKQTISIDQIRDLQHQLSLKPYAAKVKTGIILEAQRMTVEAQNALLKTLEEPPAHSILILTAPSTKSLLPTIVSRCQIVRLPSEIDLDIESEAHQQAAEEFLELLQQGRPARHASQLAGVAGGGERLAWTEENKATISNQQLAIATLEVWISVLRDLLLTQQGCQTLVLNPTIKQFIDSKNRRSADNSVKSISLCSSIQLLQKTKNLIAKTNVSPRLALEVLLLDLPIFQNI